jgi:hypothetical protein
MYKKLVVLLVVVVAFTLFTRSVDRTEAKPLQVRSWVIEDSKAYAQDVILAWSSNQYKCLNKLWTRESNWRAEAYNKVKVMGKNAGGIPQILGLDPKTPAPLQIDRGFAYIMHRYGTPCMAWKFHQQKGWY